MDGNEIAKLVRSGKDKVRVDRVVTDGGQPLAQLFRLFRGACRVGQRFVGRIVDRVFIQPIIHVVFITLREVLHQVPWAFFTGLGPGAATKLLLAFKYWLNTPVKVLLEYGIFGLIFYASLLLVATRKRRQTALVLPLFALLMFTGGYQEFSPILFPVLLITSVAFLGGASERLQRTSPA